MGKLISFTFIILLITSTIWLWQRQPKGEHNQATTSTPDSATKSARTATQNNEKLELKNPKDGQIVNFSKITFTGKTLPNFYLAIYSPDTSLIVKTGADGNYQKEVSLTPQLNLINLETIPIPAGTGVEATRTANLHFKKSISLWFENTQEAGNIIYHGSIKSIFDTLLTITSDNGEKYIRTDKLTVFDVPEDDEKTSETALKNIRISDYAIAFGDAMDENTIIAKKLQIIRKNPPQNNKKVAFFKIITSLKNNSFSAKDDNDKIVQFTVTPNTTIILDDKENKKTPIKDKNAIIFYIENSQQNLVDLVYLLP